MSHPIPGHDYTEKHREESHKDYLKRTNSPRADSHIAIEKTEKNKKKLGSYDKMHVLKMPTESNNSFKKRVNYFKGSRKSVGGKGSYPPFPYSEEQWKAKQESKAKSKALNSKMK